MAPRSLQPSHSCHLNYSSIQEVVSRHPAIIWTQFGWSEVMPKSHTLRVVWWGRNPALSPPSSYTPCLEWDGQGIFSSRVLLLALAADGNLGIETALKMEKNRDFFGKSYLHLVIERTEEQWLTDDAAKIKAGPCGWGWGQWDRARQRVWRRQQTLLGALLELLCFRGKCHLCEKELCARNTF